MEEEEKRAVPLPQSKDTASLSKYNGLTGYETNFEEHHKEEELGSHGGVKHSVPNTVKDTTMTMTG